jgi:hypothetical protein
MALMKKLLNMNTLPKKYEAHFRECTNLALVDVELHKIFPDSESVNCALRKFAEEHHIRVPVESVSVC